MIKLSLHPILPSRFDCLIHHPPSRSTPTPISQNHLHLRRTASAPHLPAEHTHPPDPPQQLHTSDTPPPHPPPPHTSPHNTPTPSAPLPHSQTGTYLTQHQMSTRQQHHIRRLQRTLHAHHRRRRARRPPQLAQPHADRAKRDAHEVRHSRLAAITARRRVLSHDQRRRRECLNVGLRARV